jgi:hypothetical protein
MFIVEEIEIQKMENREDRDFNGNESYISHERNRGKVSEGENRSKPISDDY